MTSVFGSAQAHVVGLCDVPPQYLEQLAVGSWKIVVGYTMVSSWRFPVMPWALKPFSRQVWFPHRSQKLKLFAGELAWSHSCLAKSASEMSRLSVPRKWMVLNMIVPASQCPQRASHCRLSTGQLFYGLVQTDTVLYLHRNSSNLIWDFLWRADRTIRVPLSPLW